MTSIKTCHDYKLAEDFLGHTNASAELCFRDKTVSRILQPHSETAVSVLDLKKKKKKPAQAHLEFKPGKPNAFDNCHVLSSLKKKKKKKNKPRATRHRGAEMLQTLHTFIVCLSPWKILPRQNPPSTAGQPHLSILETPLPFFHLGLYFIRECREEIVVGMSCHILHPHPSIHPYSHFL